jgi:hypothetical protein
MSTVSMSTNTSVGGQTKAPGEHGSAIAFGFIVGVLICLVAVNLLFGPLQDPGPLVGLPV